MVTKIIKANIGKILVMRIFYIDLFVNEKSI
jgi:hypothetical protein